MGEKQRRSGLDELAAALPEGAHRSHRVHPGPLSLVGEQGDWTLPFRLELGDWVVVGEVKPIEGRLAITRLEVNFNSFEDGERRAFPPGGIKTTTLRSIPFDEIHREVRDWLRELPEWDRVGELLRMRVSQERATTHEATAGVATAARRRTRRGYPEEHYRRIAMRLLELQDQGWGRGINIELARLENVSRETIRDWISGARKRGFLGPGVRGRSGAVPGPRLSETPDDEEGDSR